MNIAVVTGASSGMGREFALQLSQYVEVDEIWAIARRTEALEALKKEVSVPVRPISLDLVEEKTGERPTKLGVLSSEYHLFRASLFTKKCGVDFVGIPAPTSRMGQKINHFMREVAGVWHYLLLGGQYD